MSADLAFRSHVAWQTALGRKLEELRPQNASAAYYVVAAPVWIVSTHTTMALSFRSPKTVCSFHLPFERVISAA